MDFEKPPGVGVTSLSVLFNTCVHMHKWLAEDPAHIVVRRPPWSQLLVLPLGCCRLPTLTFVVLNNLPEAYRALLEVQKYLDSKKLHA